MICGLHIDDNTRVHLCLATEDGGRREVVETGFRPFLWTTGVPLADGMEDLPLEGAGPFNHLLLFDDVAVYQQANRDRSLESENQRPLEAQYLMQNRLRMFDGMTFARLRRCQLKIEVEAEGEAPDPMNKEDRLTAIGLLLPDGRTEVLTPGEGDERALLKRFGELLRECDPDVIEGHGLFSFDLDFLIRRCRRLRLSPAWGRFGAEATFRKSRLRVAERWIDYTRVDIPGRSVFDTFLAIQLWDISSRALQGYELDDVAAHFALEEESDNLQLTTDSSPDAGGAGPGVESNTSGNLHLPPATCNLSPVTCHLHTASAVCSLLLPTYFAQTQNFPIPLQDLALRGTGGKVDALLLEHYYHARRALPEYAEVSTFEGAFTRSYETGVFRNVLHYDVASLYPSLLMHIGRNPRNDELGIFIPLLKELRQYRLRYKQMAREAQTAELKAEYSARQQAFKILINSFYGYLGFGQARFADPELAAEVTRRGRELLQKLIEEFQALGCTVLEADTDGIYVASEQYFAQPEVLLKELARHMPDGIDLEFDGSYKAMFCYKAKNYALYDGEQVAVTGSALRSRGIEPYLMRLTEHLIRHLLGAEPTPPAQALREVRARIAGGTMDVRSLAKSEYLSMSPTAYERKMATGGKPRRASLEVAARMVPRPRMGERVRYYIGPKTKGQTSDWQRAFALSEFDPQATPYDPKYYLKKLDDWEKRYEEFLDKNGGTQDEMF